MNNPTKTYPFLATFRLEKGYVTAIRFGLQRIRGVKYKKGLPYSVLFDLTPEWEKRLEGVEKVHVIIEFEGKQPIRVVSLNSIDGMTIR